MTCTGISRPKGGVEPSLFTCLLIPSIEGFGSNGTRLYFKAGELGLSPDCKLGALQGDNLFIPRAAFKH